MPKVVLNPSFTAYQGKLGSIVYQEGREGTIARRYVVPKDPRTAAQIGARTAFAQASEAYKALSAAEVAAWRRYAEGLTRRGRNGKPFHPAAMDVFVSLTSKFLQVNPGASVPTAPPAAAFFGDALQMQALGLTGVVLFEAVGINTDATYTELLLQRLADANRKPEPGKYRSWDFVQFDRDMPQVGLAVQAGWIAPAYRYVNVMTGQMTPLLPLPPVHVT